MLLLCHLLLVDALAQDDGGFDARGFSLMSAEPDVRDPLTFLRPGAQPDWGVSLGVVGHYASRPVVFEPTPGDRQAALENLFTADVAAGVVPVQWLRLGIQLPVVMAATSQGEAVSAGVGDASLNGLVLLSQPDRTADVGVGVGVAGRLSLPTGDAGALLGEDGLSGSASLVATLESRGFTLSGELGGQFSPNTPPEQRPAVTKGGDAVHGALALNGSFDERFGGGVEVWAAYPVDPDVRSAVGIPANALASMRYAAPNGLFVTAGVGTGLGAGAGASPLRAVLGGGFLVGPSQGDDDADGVVNALDLCAGEAETVNGFDDGDGCADELPRLTFTVEGPEALVERARLELRREDGTSFQGMGEVSMNGLPGQQFVATANAGGCLGGTIEVQLGRQSASHVVPLRRRSAQTRVHVHDAANRPLVGTTVRYIADHPECVPEDASVVDGKGEHIIGAGEHTILITAPGYDIYREVIQLDEDEVFEIDALLYPTQVRVGKGRLELSAPLQFEPGSSALADASQPVLAQIASVLLSEDLRVRITGFTDARGAGGKQLSWNRAEYVMNYLAGEGVSTERMQTDAATGPANFGHIEITIL